MEGQNIKDDTMSVIHAVNTSGEKCSTGENWLEFWKKKMEERDYDTTDALSFCYCCRMGLCEIKSKNPDKEIEMVGAHVYSYPRIGDSEQTKYIVPTCNICNSRYQFHLLGKCKVFSVPRKYLVEIDED